jgi:uncharacterized RDD family membrane protein YckC
MKRHAILTPEHVLVELPPAGLGSRFVALTVDFAIIVGASALAAQVIGLFLPAAVAGAAVTTVAFAIGWSYHIYFEVGQQGRSPGKRLVGLRVVDGHGLPLTLQQSFLRNAARALDMMPFAYGLGALACRLDPQHRRLGDLLADTLVIREARKIDYDRRETRSRAFNSLKTPRVLRLLRRRVGLAEREFLLHLVERAQDLTPEARFQLMQDVGTHYREVLGLDDPHLSGENLVRGLAAILAAGRTTSPPAKR